jgi:hypothetical protein
MSFLTRITTLAVSLWGNLKHAIAGHRMAPWMWVSLLLIGAVGLFQPQLLPVSLYKLSLITTAAWLAYWIDRALFPYARPDAFLDTDSSLGTPLSHKVLPTEALPTVAFVAAQIRRAIIIAAAMIAVALGA